MKFVLFMTALTLLLNGCGGGGGPTDTTMGSSPTISLTRVDISLSSDLPAEIRARVASIDSAVDSSRDGRGLGLLPTPQVGVMLTMALDSTNRPLMLGFWQGPGTVLGAESTALALARLAIGVLPSGVSVQRIDNAIKSAPSYGALTTAIASALQAGNMAVYDLTVLGLVTTVLSELTLHGDSANANRLQIQALPEATVTELPGVLYEYFFQPSLKVSLTTATTASSASLINATPISWAAERRSENESVLASLPAMPPVSLVQAANNTIPEQLLLGGTDLRYAIRLYQSLESKRENSKILVKEFVSIALGFAQGAPLVSQQLDNRIDALFAAFESSGGAANRNAVDSFIRRIFLDLILNDALNSLGYRRQANVDFLTVVRDLSLDGLTRVSPIARVGNAAVVAASFATKLGMILANQDFDQSVAVCFGNSGALSNCAEEPPGVSIAVSPLVRVENGTGTVGGMFSCNGDCANARNAVVRWSCIGTATLSDGSSMPAFPIQLGVTNSIVRQGSFEVFPPPPLGTVGLIAAGTLNVACGAGTGTFQYLGQEFPLSAAGFGFSVTVE